MIRAACTIVSFNYLPYARTLCDSFCRFHRDYKFYVLLVDRLPAGFDRSSERFELVLVEDLGIPDFPQVAFKYGILELNTNVKPTFLKRILADGVDQIIYLDPDIFIYATLAPLYSLLSANSIVLTPHCMSPNEAGPYSEVLLLVNGVFNLGFIAVSKCAESSPFLDWWEHRCLSLGYNERWAGLFVDQKWINLAPCYFDSVHVLKHPGCNVAYWNLHERRVELTQGGWIVNGSTPLLFFHFSGMSVSGGDRISKHTDQFNLSSRPELVRLFVDYRKQVVANTVASAHEHNYAFGRFDNGELVTKLHRAVFAANLERFGMTNPFDSQGSFYQWIRQHHLNSKVDTGEQYGRKTYTKDDRRVRFVNAMMRLLLRLLGPNRYTILMKYLEYASVLRNQKEILE